MQAAVSRSGYPYGSLEPYLAAAQAGDEQLTHRPNASLRCATNSSTNSISTISTATIATTLAHTLGVKQAAVAQIDRRTDMLTQHPGCFVEVMGKRTRIVANFARHDVCTTNLILGMAFKVDVDVARR